MPVVDLSTFLTDLGAFLEAASCGTLGSTLFLGQFPSGASVTSACSILTETQGPASDDPRGVAFPRVQIMTRSQDYSAARTRAHLIHTTLHDQIGIVIGSYGVNCNALQLPFKIGIDQRQCHLLSCNYQFDVM